MTKQGNTQSRGSVEDGTEITSDVILQAVLDLHLDRLEEPIGDAMKNAADAIGQALSSGSAGPEVTDALAEAEDAIEAASRSLARAKSIVFGSAS
jgi:hypothetical protein